MKLHLTGLTVLLTLVTTVTPSEAKVLKNLNDGSSYPSGVQTLVSPKLQGTVEEQTEVKLLFQMGLEQYRSQQYEQAIATLEQALSQFRKLNDGYG
ncbi:MAG: hypothetical protein SWJ54_21200, partial [Cyanobacteriota bacterium]|nr:hypothetical protein [Cyanobacteriota bacterium]